MSTARWILTALLFSSLAACTPLTDESTPVPAAVDAGGLLFDHATVVGMLRLVNDASSDLAFLMDIVGLDNAPADAIVRHRQGVDRLDGTWDDDPFEDGFELAELPAVDAADMQMLGWTAESLDLVPDLVLEGVPFTRQEAEAALLLANVTSLNRLDGALDSRAAESIVLGRPYDSLVVVAERPHLGPGALEDLRGLAQDWLDEGDDTVED